MDREKAITAVKAWWKSGFKARDLKRTGEVTECYPIYVPFWKLRARASGWVCGYNLRQHDKYTEKIPKEVLVSRYFDWNHVACDPGDIGIEHLHGLEGTAALHDDGTITTFEATTSFSDARTMGLESVRNQAISEAGVSNKTFIKLHVFLKDMGLVFYPIWIMRYKYSGHGYFATVDGVTGRVLSGRAPGDYLWRSLAMTGGMAIGGFGSMFGLWLAVVLSNGQGGGTFGLIVSLGCLAVAGASFMFYRYGAEVTTGDVKSEYKSPTANGLGALAQMAGQGPGKIMMEEFPRSR